MEGDGGVRVSDILRFSPCIEDADEENRLTIPIYEKEEMDAEARAYGTKFRDTLQGDGPKRVYTNFANGDEEPSSLYGGGERLEKLRTLKGKWDPHGVFGWFNPIC